MLINEFNNSLSRTYNLIIESFNNSVCPPSRFVSVLLLLLLLLFYAIIHCACVFGRGMNITNVLLWWLLLLLLLFGDGSESECIRAWLDGWKLKFLLSLHYCSVLLYSIPTWWWWHFGDICQRGFSFFSIFFIHFIPSSCSFIIIVEYITGIVVCCCCY